MLHRIIQFVSRVLIINVDIYTLLFRNFARFLIIAHPKQNIFHAVLIFVHLIEECSFIKRDYDELNDEEDEDYVENKVVEDASNVDLDMDEDREGIIEGEVREENVDNEFLKTEESG